MKARKPWWIVAPLVLVSACQISRPTTPSASVGTMPADAAARYQPADGQVYPSGSTYLTLAVGELSISTVQVDSQMANLPKERMIDRDLATAWGNGGYQNPTSWASAQLAARSSLASVGLKTGPTPAGASFDIEVSSDGKAWVTVLRDQRNTTWTVEYKALPAGTAAQYVRVFWRNSATSPQAHFYLYELVVRGETDGTSPTPSPTPTSPTGTYPQYYPDLTAVPSKSFYISESSGTKLLRFPGTIANTGPGHMQARSTREGDVTRATQEILDPSGRVIQTKDVGTFAYHPGHGHFHVTAVARYELRRGSPTGTLVRQAPKVSFCLADSIQYQSSSEPSRYPKCLETLQGITRTYADVYNSGLPGQEFDVAGLPAGEYYFVIIVDPMEKFLDARRTNNFAWTKIYLNPSTGRVWPMATSN